MAGEAAAVIPSAPRADRHGIIGSDELAQGLLLVRASAIKVVRLQLAMERRDRRVALETVDELMMLDRRISDFLDELPASADRVASVRRELDAEGRALAREKFALAAGMKGPALPAEPNGWNEEAEAPSAGPDGESQDVPRRLGGAPLSADAIEVLACEEPRARRGPSSGLLAIIFLVAAVIAGAAAFLLLTEAGQALFARLPLAEGAAS